MHSILIFFNLFDFFFTSTTNIALAHLFFCSNTLLIAKFRLKEDDIHSWLFHTREQGFFHVFCLYMNSLKCFFLDLNVFTLLHVLSKKDMSKMLSLKIYKETTETKETT